VWAYAPTLPIRLHSTDRKNSLVAIVHKNIHALNKELKIKTTEYVLIDS